MTWSSKELLLNGVDPRALEFRKWRRAHGLSIREMAALAGLARPTVQRIETGKWPVSRKAAEKLERIMMTFTEEMRPVRAKDGRGQWKVKLKVAV